VGSSQDPVRYQLAGPAEMNIEGEIPVGGAKTIAVDPAAEGIYSVLLQGGKNAASIESTARYFAHDARTGLHIVSRARPLYFTVPAGVRSFSLSLSTAAPNESVHATIIDPEGDVAVEQDVLGGTNLEVAVPAGMSGRPWRIELSEAAEGVYEDVMGFRFSDEIPPYVTDAPGRLVVED
jgi:hypothetical protein